MNRLALRRPRRIDAGPADGPSIPASPIQQTPVPPNTRPARPLVVAASILILLLLILGLFAFDEYRLASDNFQFEPSDTVADMQTRSALAREAYNQWVIDETRHIFQWHARSTKIIFWTSMFVTITGVGYSFWQFTEASHSEQVAEHADELAVKTHFGSLAFKSRSLATFMMSISLAYFLIYVTLVYPIRSTGGDAFGGLPPGSQDAPTAKLKETTSEASMIQAEPELAYHTSQAVSPTWKEPQ